LLLAAVTLADCSALEAEPPPKPESNWTIPEARAFDEFNLYWLGKSYQGLGLTLITRGTDGDGVHHASFPTESFRFTVRPRAEAGTLR